MNRFSAPACVVFLLPVFAVASAAHAAREDLIKARMEASVPDSGPAARDEAVGRAQVEIIADLLKSTLTSEHFALVNALLSQSARYIRTTQILRCDSRDGLVHVEVECYVRRGDILKDAAAMLLPRLPAPPSVLVVILEPANETAVDAGARGTASKALSTTLKEQGFEIVDIETLRACHSDADIAAAVLGDNAAAARFARERFADVAVLGKADVSSTADPGSLNLVTCTANVTLRLFRTCDGKLADGFSGEAVVHGADTKAGSEAALQDACAKVAGDIQVAAAMAIGGTHATEDVLITIDEPGGEDRVREVVTAASAFTGQEAELLVYTDHLARIRLPYDGAMTPLLDNLSHQRYAGAALETRKAIQRNVQMRFLP